METINDGLRFQEVEGEPFYGEVRCILIIGDTTISVMYHGGTYTSTDRGETWQDVSQDWYVGNSIYSMTMFDGYLWSAMSIEWMARSPDDGQTWQPLVNFQHGRVNDWAVCNGQLYVAGQKVSDVGTKHCNCGNILWMDFPLTHPRIQMICLISPVLLFTGSSYSRDWTLTAFISLTQHQKHGLP